MKKRKIIFNVISILLVASALFLLCFVRAIPSYLKKRNNSLPNSYYLKMNKNLFYRQTLNNCGPYSVMAVINILRNEEKDPEILSKQMKWRIYKNLTFPQGVVNQLHENGIKTKEYNKPQI